MWRQVVLAIAVLNVSLPAAFAHTSAQSISIADGARLKTGPEHLTITFKHPARFGSVSLQTAAGERIPVPYSPPKVPTSTFTIPLPRLAPDRYRATWRVIAGDGHVMTGAVSFTVSSS